MGKELFRVDIKSSQGSFSHAYVYCSDGTMESSGNPQLSARKRLWRWNAEKQQIEWHSCSKLNGGWWFAPVGCIHTNAYKRRLQSFIDGSSENNG